MDNFKQIKNNRRTSIDGFIGGNPARRRPNLQGLNRHGQGGRLANQQPVIPKVDSFRSADGFVPNAQPMIPRPGERNVETEVSNAFESKPGYLTRDKAAEFNAVPKKRRFGLRRKSHKQRSHTKRPRLKLGLRIAGIAGLFMILVGGGLMLKGILASRNIFKGGGSSAILNNSNIDPTLLKGEGDGRVNILVLGKGGAEQKSGPHLTDTILIASIDPIAKEAALLSIPRDLWVKSPSGSQTKVNEVYANARSAVLNNYSSSQRSGDEAVEKSEKAGLDAIKKTLSEAMGVPINYHLMIDFTGFRKAIDTVGGIQIDVKEALIDRTMAHENGGRATIAAEGLQTFDGKRALMYARSRKGTRGTDFGRAERQREVILALKEKILSSGTLANPIKLNQLLGDFGNNMSTDLSVNEMLRVYDLAKEISADKVVSVGLGDYVKGDMINNLSVQVPKAGLFDYQEIQNYVRNIMKDAFIKNEDAKIIVLNGTTKTGLATNKSKELKSFGYNILSIGDAPTSTYSKTILVDLSDGNKKYTLNYLQKRLNAETVTTLPDSAINATGADFVIILGSNETNSQD